MYLGDVEYSMLKGALTGGRVATLAIMDHKFNALFELAMKAGDGARAGEALATRLKASAKNAKTKGFYKEAEVVEALLEPRAERREGMAGGEWIVDR